jgi:hypothetical protein
VEQNEVPPSIFAKPKCPPWFLGWRDGLEFQALR